MERGIIVTGTIGSDCHATGQWIVARFLQEKGYKVVKLGVCVSQQEFVDAAIETNCDAIFVSSLYGMGYADSIGFKERLIEAGKADILLYCGGILAVGSDFKWEDVMKQFKEIGYNRVYPRDVNLENVLVDLENDLEKKRSKAEVA